LRGIDFNWSGARLRGAPLPMELRTNIKEDKGVVFDDRLAQNCWMNAFRQRFEE
jgi:hypothetical protein